MTQALTVDTTAAELTNDTIQRAIDAAAAQGGGIVTIPAGTYTLHNAVKLRSNVRVVGEDGVILRKNACFSSRILDFLGYGHCEFSVEDPTGFDVGMGVHLVDKHAVGFYTTVATITHKVTDARGTLFYIDRMLNHDLGPWADAQALTLFPPVEGCNVQDASIENVTIDGNKDANDKLNGCRGGGVFLIGCRNITIDNVEVTNFNGDAISFQQCVDIVVRGCNLHHNTGGGLHPGSGSVRYVMENNTSSHNGLWGLFYCLRTSHSICRGNTFSHNGDAGISVGERDCDHLIAGNTIEGNGGPGISFRKPNRTSGDRVRIEGNTLRGNATKEGPAEIDIPAGLHDIWIGDNVIEPAVGKAAVTVAAGCERIAVTTAGIDDAVIEGVAHVSRDTPADFPPVGPAALPLDGALHLNIAQLPPNTLD